MGVSGVLKANFFDAKKLNINEVVVDIKFAPIIPKPNVVRVKRIAKSMVVLIELTRLKRFFRGVILVFISSCLFKDDARIKNIIPYK